MAVVEMLAAQASATLNPKTSEAKAKGPTAQIVNSVTNHQTPKPKTLNPKTLNPKTPKPKTLNPETVVLGPPTLIPNRISRTWEP